MIPTERNWSRGLLLSFVTAALWGGMPLVLKGLVDYLDPLTATSYRYFLCLLGNVAYVLILRNSSWKHLRNRRVLALVAICIAGMLINNILFLYGLRLTGPGASQVISQLGPVMLLLGSVLIFREAFSSRQWLGAALVVTGLVLFFHNRLTALHDLDGYGTGMLILMIAPVFWAAYGLAQKKMTGLLGPQQVLVMIYGAGTLLLLPIASLPAIAAMNINGHLFALGGMVVTVVSYGTFNGALAQWEASRVSAILTLTPLFTLLITRVAAFARPDLFVYEHNDALSWLGAGVVVLGSLCVAVPRYRRR
ncbi:MAG: EamA family transporter [Verrucomicrobiaceae bacterium]|nr:EamA family transporter [Verrucomicrobiaceae bacterium]